MSGDEVGQIYEDSDNALTQFVAGGYWASGVYCGCRTLSVNNSPWDVRTGDGSRFARDAL